MTAQPTGGRSAPLVLDVHTARDLMSRSPLSIRIDATIRDTAAFLVEKEISGAPVINAAGHAVGVITLTDIARHAAHPGVPPPGESDYYRELDRRCPPALRDAVYGHPSERMHVGDVMSPVVIQVAETDSALEVVSKFLALKIHRLFVIDEAGTLVGVISALDVLRCLKPAHDR